ncbi:MAG: alpha-amylase [Treponema sp.]|nr:alpha-amylase [Treponema sp.]
MNKENKLTLILGTHAHVPSGADESEFEYVYDKKMRPFVSNLYRYSNIQAVLHYSGVLLYWVERNHPELFMLIEDMVNRKQVELLGGGFYEPMMPLISPQDRIGQVEYMTTYLRKHFGKRPQGCWIPGMAWEQNLGASLCASDMSYTFLSQEQFIRAGLSGNGLFSPCISEDQGKLLTIFPVSLDAQNELAKKSFSHVFIDIINGINKKNSFCADSSQEKIIAVFPSETACAASEARDTAWNRFFEELSLSRDMAETVLPGKIIKTLCVNKRASFPNSSALENDFSPRRFLIDSCEANGIYSKMVFTNVLINQLKGDRYRKQAAREELWKAQDSSLFTPCGGRNSHVLRKSAYSSLLRAEYLSREKGKFTSSLIQHDFDLDGAKEYLFQDTRINCYIQQKGAGIFELDYLPKEWNYLDCGASDRVRRAAFTDVILPPETDLNEIKNCYPQGSRLCMNEKFQAVSQDRKGKSCFKMPALCEDAQQTEDSAAGAQLFGPLEINKCYLLKKDVLTVDYLIKNTGKSKCDFCFITNIYFSFAGGGDENVRFFTTDSGGKDTPAKQLINGAGYLKIQDVINEVQIMLGSLRPLSLFLDPVYDGGFYQANRILPYFNISLEAGASWSNEYVLKFSH